MKRTLLSFVLVLFLSIYAFAQNAGKPKGQQIIIETSLGNIELVLYDDTPLHRDNMIKLIKESYFQEQIFHRVIKNFMIQGGDPNSKNAPKGQHLGSGGPGYTIPAEFRTNHFHKRGALAAARMGDNTNPKKESSGSQFYIVQGTVLSEADLSTYQARGHKPFTPEEIEAYTTIGGSPHLDGEYTVFGEVTKGLDIVYKISTVAVDANARPIEDITFNIKLK